MIEYQYSYLILAILFLSGWLLLYIRRKNERAELLALSFPLAIFGVVADALYVKDWWNPATVLGSAPLSGEAMIASFGIVGVGAVLPEYILRLRTTSPGKILTKREISTFCITIFTMTALFYGSFFFFGVNSLVATVLTLALPTAFMWGSRRDLIPTALLNGVFLVFFAAFAYTILNYMTPGWVEEFYFFQNTPAFILLNVPLDDVVFYFFTGLFLGTFYEWWQNVKRVPLKRY